MHASMDALQGTRFLTSSSSKVLGSSAAFHVELDQSSRMQSVDLEMSSALNTFNSVRCWYHKEECFSKCVAKTSRTWQRRIKETDLNSSQRLDHLNPPHRFKVRANAVVQKNMSSLDQGEIHVKSTRTKVLQNDVGPNLTVLEAQARVCTGPTRTRPLDEAQAYKVLDAILKTGMLQNTILETLHYHDFF
jgi:hypothetical protein